MAKKDKNKKGKKSKKQNRSEGEPVEVATDLLIEEPDDEEPESPTPAANAETRRARVGRGSLAEGILDSLEAVTGEIERITDEVTALGSSLRLAREQLAEQEDELDALHAVAKPRVSEPAAGRPTPRKTTVAARDRTSAVGA